MEQDNLAGSGFGEWYDVRGFFRRIDHLIKLLERIADALEEEQVSNGDAVYALLKAHVDKLKTIGVVKGG